MKHAILAFGGAVLLVSGWAGAAGATSPAYSRCIDKSGGVTSDMRDCAFDEETRQDRDLNAFYKQALARRDAVGAGRLRTEERAWLKRRKRRCDKIFNQEGTDALLGYDGCRLDMTDKRISELKALASGAGATRRP